jgi:hypothetical protein
VPVLVLGQLSFATTSTTSWVVTGYIHPHLFFNMRLTTYPLSYRICLPTTMLEDTKIALGILRKFASSISYRHNLIPSSEPMGVYGTSTWYQGVSPTPAAHPAPASSGCQAYPTISVTPALRRRDMFKHRAPTAPWR